MTPEKARHRAHLAERLESDECYQLVMGEIKEAYSKVFLSSDSSEDEVLAAHGMIRALNEIDGQLRKMKSDAAILNRKENQHRE